MHLKKHPIFTVPLAHRGLHNELVDENSVASFEDAVKQGFGLEIDIHLTKDEKVVIIHDYTTTRVTGVEKKVTESTLAELNKLSLLKTKSKIPQLKDVLKIVDGKVPILIELKAESDYNPAFAKVVIDELKDYEYKDTVALQSFNPFLTKEMKEMQDEIIIGQLSSDEIDGQTKFVQFLFRSLLVLRISRPDFFAYEVKYIKKRKVQRKRRKFPLLAWTVDDESSLEIARKYADNIIFENIKP